MTGVGSLAAGATSVVTAIGDGADTDGAASCSTTGRAYDGGGELGTTGASSVGSGGVAAGRDLVEGGCSRVGRVGYAGDGSDESVGAGGSAGSLMAEGEIECG